ncbi:hypothetical protein Q7P35_008659 [Cladosporium inversicolor]
MQSRTLDELYMYDVKAVAILLSTGSHQQADSTRERLLEPCGTDLGCDRGQGVDPAWTLYQTTSKIIKKFDEIRRNPDRDCALQKTATN